MSVEPLPRDVALQQRITAMAAERLRSILAVAKTERQEAMNILEHDIVQACLDDNPPTDTAVTRTKAIKACLHDLESQEMRRLILTEGRRADGRSLTDIRPIHGRVSFLPRTHGSALFTRGETQALVVATLGTQGDEQLVDDLEGKSSKQFMLHYNFPPYSVGEVAPLRVQDAVRLGMVRWRKELYGRCFPGTKPFHIPCVLSQTSWSLMAPLPWQPYMAARWL